jgi:GTP-binding protein
LNSKLEFVFIDRAKIRVKAGDGGNGVTAFRREKFVPRGGPSGGDGGVGGSVWIESDEGLNTLLHLRYNPEHKAERGRHGEGSNRSGKDGEDALVRVPVGTQVYDAESNELLFDFLAAGTALSRRKRRERRLGKLAFCNTDETGPEISLQRPSGRGA